MKFKIKILRNTKIEYLNMIMILALAVLIGFYMFMANNVVTANYQKVLLQKNIDNLKTEIMNFNLELVDKRSVGFLKKAAQEIGLVINKSIQYIKISGPVAKQ
jgi:Tfp pilus assembly protein PilN